MEPQELSPKPLAPAQFAPLQFAPEQSAPEQSAPEQSAPEQSTPEQFMQQQQQFMSQQFAPQQSAPDQLEPSQPPQFQLMRRPVVIAELSDDQLFHFVRQTRTHESTHNKDLSYLIVDLWDLARVSHYEKHLRWAKHGAFIQGAFGLTFDDWEDLVCRLMIVLDSGLEPLDYARLSHMEATNNPQTVPDMMVEVTAGDGMKLFQKAWKLLGLALNAQLGILIDIPQNCSLAYFDSFRTRFTVIEQALQHNKMLARQVFDDPEWMCRIAAHPVPEVLPEGYLPVQSMDWEDFLDFPQEYVTDQMMNEESAMELENTAESVMEPEEKTEHENGVLCNNPRCWDCEIRKELEGNAKRSMASLAAEFPEHVCHDEECWVCAAKAQKQPFFEKSQEHVCNDEECWICPAKAPKQTFFETSKEYEPETLSAEDLWEGLHIEQEYGQYEEDLCINKELEGVCNDEQCQACIASGRG